MPIKGLALRFYDLRILIQKAWSVWSINKFQIPLNISIIQSQSELYGMDNTNCHAPAMLYCTFLIVAFDYILKTCDNVVMGLVLAKCGNSSYFTRVICCLTWAERKSGDGEYGL